MHTRKHSPGKFEACESELVARILYDILGISGQDDEVGDAENFGFFALIKGKKYYFIVSQDSQGFFEYDYGLPRVMGKKWRILQDEYESFLEDQESED